MTIKRTNLCSRDWLESQPIRRPQKAKQKH